MKALLVIILASAAASMELAPLMKVKEPIPGRYIVKLKNGESVDNIIATLGNVNIRHKYKAVFSGFAAQLTDRMVQRLRESSAVEYIEEDGVARVHTLGSWGLDRVDQLALPLNDVFEPVGDGSRVHVYVIDTGINSGHEDLAGRAFLAYDVITNTVGAGEDCYGHGAHCAGTVAGTFYGVAKQAYVHGVRVFDCAGSGATSNTVAGCEWVAANHNGPAVASMSLGGSASEIMDDAVQSMVDAGITVVVSAGNSDRDACDISPARSPNVITVGATDSTDTRAEFSNYGPCVDIFAPGVDITSSYINGNGAIKTMSGTSMSCPHVAGAAAVLLGIDPTITPEQMKTDLQLKAIPNAINMDQDPAFGSPNLVLYIGEGSAGGFIPTPPPPCEIHTAASGTFISRNYPSNYDNEHKCDYLITVPSGVITLTFDDFELETGTILKGCLYDSVTIYDGDSSSALSLGEYCGSNVPGPFTSTGSNLYIVFSTDFITTERGFSASYESA